MKRRLGLVTVFCAISAFAQTYVWQGGASGTWAEPSNWNPNGTPGAGDAASFASTVEITDGFTVGEGTLTIDVATDKELSLKGVIAGTGAIAKTGSGAISLYGENTFSGGFTAGTTAGSKTTMSYHGATLECNSECGIIGLWNGSGFGSGKAVVNSILFVNGGITVASELDKGWGNGRLYVGKDGVGSVGPVTFAEPVTVRGNLPFGGGNGTITFKKKVTANNSGNAWYSNSGGGGPIVFEDDFDGSTKVLMTFGISTLDFYGANNAFNCIEIATRVAFHTANSIASDSVLKFTGNGGKLDLCGVDQTLNKASRDVNMLEFSSDTSITGYVIHSDTPAQLILSSTAAVAYNDFRGRFTGCAGFSMAKNGNGITLNGQIQPTRGTFTFSGTAGMGLKGGAGFSNLGALELKSSNGYISLRADDAGDVVVNRLTCQTQWCGIRLADSGGAKIYCRTFTYAGSDKPDGTYTKDGASEYVAPVADPDGGIVVNSQMPNRFVGASGGDWSVANNWWFGTVPAAGEAVGLDNVSVSLTSATPVLGNVSMAGSTLTMSGWDTALNAADVVLNAGTTVTTPGAFTTDADKSRVSITCANLTIAAGAAIDVSKKGWSCGLPTTSSGTGSTASGYGPGAGTAYFGAAHGGPGGKNPASDETTGLPPAVYGSVSEPTEPGSGGYQNLGTTAAITGTHGGGAVRIAATGTVTVNGSILANGGAVQEAGTSSLSDRRDTAGSGGSIWITCAKIAGTGGVIAANGGDGSEPCFPKWTWRTKNMAKPAGGGRIAIAYGDGQSAGDLVNMTISACAGLYTGISGYFTGTTTQSGKALPLASQSKFRNNAELGSVWFTDGKLVTATLGSGLSGQVVNPVGYTTADDVAFTNGWVRFGGEGVAVSIGGSLAVSNDVARLEIGGAAYTANNQAVSMAGISAGQTPIAFYIGGDLSVADGARLDIRSAETNAASAFGAAVTVAGNLTVGVHATVAPWSDLYTGGSVRFAVGGDFTVAADGTFTADGLGFAAKASNNDPSCGLGRGTGTAAGSYGGKGGIGYNNGSQMTGTAAATYGDEQLPALAGSGGSYFGFGFGGNGGGVVYVCAKGDLFVNGRVSANGAQAVAADEEWNVKYSAWQPSGSGGSVYLFGKSFNGTGIVQANGGDGRQQILNAKDFMGLQAVGRGGGGRVSVWTGVTDGENLKIRKVASVAELAGGFSGSCLATTGAVDFRYDAPTATREAETPACTAGAPGTVCYYTVRERAGMSIIVR